MDKKVYNSIKDIDLSKYEYLLFDLDGTLTDSSEGIINSVIYALDKVGIKENDRVKLLNFIGPPLQASFEKYYGFTPEEAGNVIVHYRECYEEKGMFENRLYDGIEDTLKFFKEKGKKIMLATSKAEEYAIMILEHFNIRQYFDYVAGASLEIKRTAKKDVILYGCEKFNEPSLEMAISKSIMIGDTIFDIVGAKACGMDSIGVLYGFGDMEEFKDAAYIAENP